VTFPNLFYTVRSDLVDGALTPELIDGPTVAIIRDHSYRVEAWRLVDGQNVLIVRALVDAPSLANRSESIAAVAREQWGNDVLIIEDWGRSGLAGDRYWISNGEGGRGVLDEAGLRARGLVLTDDLVQEI
jgi:hypothetical protein